MKIIKIGIVPRGGSDSIRVDFDDDYHLASPIEEPTLQGQADALLILAREVRRLAQIEKNNGIFDRRGFIL